MQSEEFSQFTGLIGQLPSANMSARQYLTWTRYERQKTFVTGSLRDKVDKKISEQFIPNLSKCESSD